MKMKIDFCDPETGDIVEINESQKHMLNAVVDFCIKEGKGYRLMEKIVGKDIADVEFSID